MKVCLLCCLALLGLAFNGCRPQLPPVKPGTLSLEDAEKTIAQLSDSIAKGTTDPKIYLECGKAYTQKARVLLRKREVRWEVPEEVPDQLEKAVNLLSKGITLDPLLAELYYHRGVALSLQGRDWSRILASLETARRLDPNNVEVLTRLGAAYLDRSGIMLNSVINRVALPVWIERSQKVLEGAIGLDPMYAEAHLRLGDINFIEGHFQTALQEYSRAIELGIQDPDECMQLSSMYPRCAADDLQQLAIKIPKVALLPMLPAFGVLASPPLSFNGIQRYLLERAIALDTNYSQPLAWLIPRLVSTGDTVGALNCYFKLQRMDATRGLIQYYSGPYSVYLFYSREAVEFLRAATRMAPEDYIPHLHLGYIYAEALEKNTQGKGIPAKNQTYGWMYTRLDDAIVEYEKAITLNPHSGAAYTGLASISAIKGDTTQALQYLQNALATKDTTISAKVIESLIELNRLDDVSRLVASLVKRPRKRSEFYAYIADSYLGRGDVQNAERYCSKSLAENGRNRSAEETMGMILAKKSNAAYESLLGCEVVANDGVRVAVIAADTSTPLSLLKASNWYYLPEPELASPASYYNTESPYGGVYGAMSPFNPNTTTPPRIMRGGTFVSYLSDNPNIKPRVPASRLVGFLRELSTRSKGK